MGETTQITPILTQTCSTLDVSRIVMHTSVHFTVQTKFGHVVLKAMSKVLPSVTFRHGTRDEDV
ncbi:hypothetical protein DPMN_091953 [Dreissena polymorpha]|uniref:Uncharacterized protein n=1 Tax=Dreissena polymorpha TaxID=45954 RepID=A0A9D4L133_DREPO|nr:hypothetical protein DPMN_091953 [Dreissena polymorpha]